MYAYIKGIITEITSRNIVVENNGIGYEVIVANPYSFTQNMDITIYLYQYVREDMNLLYGFKTLDEKNLFLKLISVNGIGPKSALSIIASATVNEITAAIESRNDKYLQKFPGIGPKASQQIILDLKGKVNFDELATGLKDNSKMLMLTDALLQLGYAKKDITKALGSLDLSLDEGLIIKEALKKLNK